MITGRITYHLFGLKFLPVSRKFTCPESFDELTYSQLLWWIEEVYLYLNEWFTIEDDKVMIADVAHFNAKRIEVCRKLINCPTWLWSTLPLESIRDMLYTWQLPDFTYNTIYKPKENPVKRIAGYYGPIKSDHLVPWEFTFADAFYLNYKNTQDIRYLDSFIAQLYREPVSYTITPENFTTDIRVKYNNESDVLRLDAIRKAPMAEKHLAMYWYESWRNSLPQSYKYLFSQNNEKKAAKHQSWLPVILTASNGVQNLEQIKYTNLLIFLVELNRLMKQQVDLERKKKKNE